MRILQVSGVFCDELGGGVGDYVCSLGTRLIKLGHTVDLVTYSVAPAKRDHQGLVVHYVPLSSLAGFRYFQWGRDANRFVRTLQKSAGFDLVHAHTTSMAFPLYYDSPAPMVITSHGTAIDPVHGLLRQLALSQIERKYYAKAARVIAVSPSVKQELLLKGIPEILLEVIPNGTDEKRFGTSRLDKKAARERLGINPNEIAVLFVGAHTVRKGFRVLLEVIERTLTSRLGAFKFLVAGKGPLTTSLQRLSNKHAEVVALGFVPEDTLGLLYVASDVLVFPSLYEGLPTVVLDALGSGLPVIVSDIPSLRGSLAPDSAIFVQPNDPDSLFQALKSIASDPEILARLAATARSEAPKYNWDTIVDRVIRVYSDALRGAEKIVQNKG